LLSQVLEVHWYNRGRVPYLLHFLPYRWTMKLENARQKECQREILRHFENKKAKAINSQLIFVVSLPFWIGFHASCMSGLSEKE